MKSIAGIFLVAALYSPLIWYISSMTDKYGSIDLAPYSIIVIPFLLLMPLVVFHFISESSKE